MPEIQQPSTSGGKIAFIVVSFTFLGVMVLTILVCVFMKMRKRREDSVCKEMEVSGKEKEIMEKQKSDLIENYFNSKISFYKDDDLETFDFTHSTSRKIN